MLNQTVKEKMSALVLAFMLALQGALKSWTIWVNTAILALPYAFDNIAMLQPYMPANLYAKIAFYLPLINFVLRMKTNSSLASKVDSPLAALDSLRNVVPMLAIGLLGLAMMLPRPALAALVSDPVRRVHGAIYRSSAEVAQFRKTHACPGTGRFTGACSGYVVDHKDALRCAKTETQRKRLDVPGNMQWQTLAASRIKDLTEGQHCPKVI